MPTLISNISIKGGQGKTTALQTLAIELSNRDYPVVIRDLDIGSKSTLAMQRHDLPFEIIGVSEKRPSNMVNLLDTPASYIYNSPDEALRYYASSNIILNCVSGGAGSVSNAIEVLAHLYALEKLAEAQNTPVELVSKVVTIFTRNNHEPDLHAFRLHTPQLGQDITAFYALPDVFELETLHAKGEFINVSKSGKNSTYSTAISDLADLVEQRCKIEKLKIVEAA